MATVTSIETSSADGKLRLLSRPDGCVEIALDENEWVVSEESLIEAVLEYAHERGLRRRRRGPVSAKPRKPRRTAKPAATNGAAVEDHAEAASA